MSDAVEAARRINDPETRTDTAGFVADAVAVASALLAAVEGSALDTDQIVMDWMRARADWDSEAGDACRTILNVFMAAFPQRTSDANGRDGLPFNETDLNQLRQVREELRNRWRASAFRLLDATIVDIENRAAVEGSALTPRDERAVTNNARDAVIEECAQVANEFRPSYPDASEFAKGANHAARMIWAAISELKTSSNDRGEARPSPSLSGRE